MDAFDISASAMTAQRMRMDVIASNLANVNTTRSSNGKVEAYRRKNVVFAPILEQASGRYGKSFASSLPLKPSSHGAMGGRGTLGLDNNGIPTLKASIQHQAFDGAGVKVVEITEDTETPLRQVYDPEHPDANDEGYVMLPNINPVKEMVDMISATRAYEANVSSIQATKSMMNSALEI